MNQSYKSNGIKVRRSSINQALNYANILQHYSLRNNGEHLIKLSFLINMQMKRLTYHKEMTSIA